MTKISVKNVKEINIQDKYVKKQIKKQINRYINKKIDKRKNESMYQRKK